MMKDIISVGLDIHNESIHRAFTTLLAAQAGFRLHTLQDSEFPQLLILEMDDDPAKTFSQVDSIINMAPETEIFLTSPQTDSGVLLEALRAGVKEFIPQPLRRDELEQALKRCKERCQQHKSPRGKKGKVLNFIGSKGGVGTTTIAVNLALALQEAHPQRSVVLVDLNPHFGDVALFLDLTPTHTLADIAKNMARLDETFVQNVLCKHPSGLAVLPSVDVGEDLGLLTPESVRRTLELLQTSFDYVVLDSGHTLDDNTIAPLSVSPLLFLVCTLTLPAVRNSKRFLDVLSKAGFAPENSQIIVNRYKSKNREITLRDLESILKQKPFWLIPNDYLTTLTAINTGEPLSAVSQRAKITRNFKEFAIALTKEKENKPLLFSRLFR